MSSLSGSLLSTSGFSRPSDSRPARSYSLAVAWNSRAPYRSTGGSRAIHARVKPAPLPPCGLPATIFTSEPDNLPRLVLPARLDMQMRARMTLGQIAGDRAARDFSGGFRSAARRNPRMPRDAARCDLMACDAVEMISSVRDYHAAPRRLSWSKRHDKYCSAAASAAANSGSRCLRSSRTYALFSRPRRAFTRDIWLTAARSGAWCLVGTG